MSNKVFFVTNASSKTGSFIAKLLLEVGKYTIRLGTRNPSKLSKFHAQGAEIVHVDHSLESIIEAFKNVDGIYIVLPALIQNAEHVLMENYIKAAKEANVKHIVYLSAMDVDVKSYHRHKEYEQMVFDSEIPYTILRPTWFHENVVNYHATSVKKEGVFRTSAGDGVYTSVAIADIAAVVVEVLTNPEQHVGKIYTLTGEALSEKQVAQILSKVIGKEVKHVNLTPEEHTTLLKQTSAGWKSPEEFANALVLLDKNKRDNLFNVVDPTLEQVLGRKAISLEEVLVTNVSAFKD
ncbi:unnamed protein product [Sphagnum troendelagicum]|uniref:NAD(P)-binding domain-containing protein n=1 Tax=Sphagnum troendelagicum TaxID=128251 RepID=A0ABP0UCA9_9BRYO